ncbi:MAG: site-specific integrase [Pyrinomonadaceae bacterium]
MPEEKKEDWRKQKRKIGGGIKTINGNLYARIQYVDENTGKRKEKLKRAENRTKARDYVKEMRSQLEEGGQVALETDKITFTQVAEKFEKIKLVPPVFQNGLKVAGKRSYRDQKYSLKPLKEFFGRKQIRKIKPSDLEAYKIKRLNTPVVIKKKIKKENPKKERRKFVWEKIEFSRPRTIASVNRELALLRQIFVFAEAEDYILRNPFKKAKKLISTAAEVQRDRVLSFNEERLLLEACENENRRHIRPIIICALDTAMRVGELLKLRWKDVDLINGVITVQATNSKTEKMRKIGLTKRVNAELSKVWDLSLKDELQLVFGIKNNFNRAWRTARKEAGLDKTDLHFHDLRHTAITRLILSGVSISEAMKISGHTEMKTFQRYVNLTNETVMSSANLLDKFNSAKKAEIEPSSQLLN